ncbi:MAG: hypothetical protein LBC47_08720 [Tannerella sp.]|jgi:hypothetical protein|nr:hypothetical protein [Tannerella sp.]
MNEEIYIDIEIDKLTNSIENRITGDIFDTEVIQLSGKDKRQIKKTNWRFNWHTELSNENRQVYKLIINNNKFIIQGLLSLEVKTDHIYMHLIESASFNCGKDKVYLGVPGNLVAYACKISFDHGFDGYVAFDAKTALIRHYQETLYATHFTGTKMYIETPAALRLVKQYFYNKI